MSTKKGPQYYFLILCLAAGSAVSLASIFGLLTAVPWLSIRIPAITLLILNLVMGYLVMERGNKLEKIESLVRRAIYGAEVQTFETRQDFFEYIVGRIKKASTFDVTHFGVSAPDEKDNASLDYYRTLARLVRRRKLKVRRVLAIKNQAHLDWIRQMLTDFDNCPDFFLRTHSGSGDDVPMMDLMIIDSTEVCFGGGERERSLSPTGIIVKHSGFARHIQNHFSAMWLRSKPIRSLEDLPAEHFSTE